MDGYEEVRTLGVGGSGRAIVARARPGGPQGLWAIKQVACQRDLTSANKALFEATTLLSLRHPHVVRMHEVFLAEQGAEFSVCLVMEFCAAGDLGQHLVEMRRRRDSLLAMLPGGGGEEVRAREEMLEWMRQLADALEYVHRNGIIHRDLKPANVFLQAQGPRARSVRLGDFGVAAASRSAGSDQHDTRVGTLAYLAPEVLFGGEHGARVDIWGFGCVALELMTLDFLWENSDKGLLGARVSSQGPIRPSSLPSAWPLWVRQLVTACLVESPAQRPSASALLRTLNRGTAQDPDAVVSQAASKEHPASEATANEDGWLSGVSDITFALFSSWMTEGAEGTTREHCSAQAPEATRPSTAEPRAQMRAAAVQREDKPEQESRAPVRCAKLTKEHKGGAKGTAATRSASAQALLGAQDNSHAAPAQGAQGQKPELQMRAKKKKESASSVIDAAIGAYCKRACALDPRPGRPPPRAPWPWAPEGGRSAGGRPRAPGDALKPGDRPECPKNTFTSARRNLRRAKVNEVMIGDSIAVSFPCSASRAGSALANLH